MPNRIIREGITTSEPLATTSFQAECLFYRLIVVADDFGAFDGRPVIVRAKCLPLRDSTIADVEGWLRELAEHSLIVQYESEGKPYLAIPKFKQRTRAASSKYPLPLNWQTVGGHSTVNGQSSAHGDGDGDVFDNGDGSGGAASPPPAICLTLNTGAEHPITADQVREFTDLYPAVDVMAELRKMRGWLIANPANRKTVSGILRFVTRWLGKEQDKGAKGDSASSRPQTQTPKQAMAPTETKLERAVNWARQQHHNGQIDAAERDRLIAEATAKHRSNG